MKLHRMRRPQEREERGQALIIMVFITTIILVISVIVADFGLVLSERNNLRIVADAAALAGAEKLDGTAAGATAAKLAAQQYAQQKGDTVPTTCSSGDVSSICVPPSQGPHAGDTTNKYIEVKIRHTVGLEFGSIFGASLTSIPATGRSVGTQVHGQSVYAIFTYGTTAGACDGDITMSGGNNTVNGLIHANGDLTTSGSSSSNPTTLTGGTTYGCTINTDGHTTISPPAQKTGFDPWPLTFTTSQFPCDFGTLAGPTIDLTNVLYADLSADPSGKTLKSGVYCSGTEIKGNLNGYTGTVTLVTGGSNSKIDPSGGGSHFTPYKLNVLAFSAGTSDHTIVFSGKGQQWEGLLVAYSGGVELSGGSATGGQCSNPGVICAGLFGAIMARVVPNLSGGGLVINAAFLPATNLAVALVE